MRLALATALAIALFPGPSAHAVEGGARASTAAGVSIGLSPPAFRKPIAHNRRPLDSTLTKGRKLGEGDFKKAFTVVGRPNLALVLTKGRDHRRIDGEVATYAELTRLGFPVPRIHDQGSYEGRPALVLQRFAGAHDNVGRGAFTARTARDARRIVRLLDQHQIEFFDPQYLVAKNGGIAVFDIGGITPRTGPRSATRSIFATLAEVATSAAEERRLRALATP